MRRFVQVCLIVLIVPGCSFKKETNLLPELALLSSGRSLSAYKFSYSGADKTWSSGQCNVQDEPTGIGPFTFFVDAYSDDVLITLSSNMLFTNPVCDSQNKAELNLYVDGARVQTLYNQRCWGQRNPLASALVVPLGLGYHTMELKYCSHPPLRIPRIEGAFPTVLTATILGSSGTYRGRNSSLLPIGTTSLPSSGGFASINNGSMNVAFSSPDNALIWQNLNLSGMDHQVNTSLRNSSFSTEDLNLTDDGPFPISHSTYSSFTGGNFNATAQYNSTGDSIITRSTYDSAFNLLAFSMPPAESHGKASITVTQTEAAGTLTTLLNVPITRSSAATYLISFSGNQVHNTGAGGDCEFSLYVNNIQTAATIFSSSNGTQTMGASIFSVDSVPAGTAIPVEVRYRRLAASCVVDQATLTAIPLE